MDIVFKQQLLYNTAHQHNRRIMITTPKKPQNYLNNKDILKEIHLSKNTYCSYRDPKEDHKYDYIIDAPDSTLHDCINLLQSSEVIQQAREAHSQRLEAELNIIVNPDDIPLENLVFRIMTWDHVPLSPKQPRKVVKKKSARDFFDFDNEEEEEDKFADLEEASPTHEVNDMVHVRVNFPPFQHYRLNTNSVAECVGKSHWIGDMNSGFFSKDHGQITNKLAKMYMMMCEKYAMKFNWRSYTYNDEMKASAILQLTYVGLRFNEAKSKNPFAYYTAAITNSFRRVLNTEKGNQNIRDDILIMNNLKPSWSRMSLSSDSGGIDTYYD